MFLSSFVRGLEWYSLPLPHEVWDSWRVDALPLFRTRFRVFDDPMTSLLFRARFEVIFLSSFAQGFGMASFLFRLKFENKLCITMLLFFSARGSKLTLICWYFYPPPLEVRSWSRFTDTFILLRSGFEVDLWWWLVHFTGLTLEGQSNLVLFWSYTWKPVKFVV